MVGEVGLIYDEGTTPPCQPDLERDGPRGTNCTHNHSYGAPSPVPPLYCTLGPYVAAVQDLRQRTQK